MSEKCCQCCCENKSEENVSPTDISVDEFKNKQATMEREAFNLRQEQNRLGEMAAMIDQESVKLYKSVGTQTFCLRPGTEVRTYLYHSNEDGLKCKVYLAEDNCELPVENASFADLSAYWAIRREVERWLTSQRVAFPTPAEFGL